MLDSIRVKNFKNIKDTTVKLDYVNVLVGSNNAGKSSILQAIQFAVAVAQSTTFEFARWNRKVDVLPTSLTPEQLIYSPLKNAYALGYGGQLKEPREQGIHIDFFESVTDRHCKVLVRRGKNKNLGIEIHRRSLGEEIRNLAQPFSVYVPGLAGIPAFEEFKSPGIVTRAAARGDANNVLRNIIYQLSLNVEKWDKFINDLRSIFNLIDVRVAFDFDKDEYINVDVKTADQFLPIDAAGTGVLQAIQILAYINLYKPKLLILDEPDAHLHPNNQRKLAEKLHSLATSENFQIILSTHSRHLLFAFEGLAKINWIHEGRVVEEDLNIINVLVELGALDKADFLKNPNVKLIILTEDTHTKPLEKIISSSGFTSDEFEFWSYEGCSDIKTANVLASFIKKNAPNLKIVLHRDRDFNSEEELSEIFKNLKDEVDYIFVTEGTDIESHFITKEHINYLIPEISLEDVEAIIHQSLVEARNKSFTKLLNVLTDKSLKEKRGHQAGRNAEIANKLLDENPIFYSQGKITVGHLKSIIQQRLGRNIDLYVESEFIKHPIFEKAKEDTLGKG